VFGDRHAFVAFCGPNRKGGKKKPNPQFVRLFQYMWDLQGIHDQWVGYKSWSKLHTTRNTDKQRVERDREIFLEK
jgi:hypothetical protein